MIFVFGSNLVGRHGFEVTRIGCGLSGYSDGQIAPMFADAPSNCLLPEGWRSGNMLSLVVRTQHPGGK